MARVSSNLDYELKKELREQLQIALAFADGHELSFVAIRISEALDALDADLDSRPDNADP